MSWDIRLNAPADHVAYLDYNTINDTDNGTVMIEMAGQTFTIGCALKPVSTSAPTFMIPIAIHL